MNRRPKRLQSVKKKKNTNVSNKKKGMLRRQQN